jgi:excisionase family DNA binding protein
MVSEVVIMKERISVDEIAQVIGYHKVYVYWLLKEGRIPNKKVLGRIIVFKDDFYKWLSSIGEHRNG